MKSSAHNHFEGTVEGLRRGAVNDEIELAVADGVRIVATVTRRSCEQLGLDIGTKAFALVKASSIILLTDVDDVKLSARNRLTGTVTRVASGAINTEVVVRVAGGTEVVAVVTNESASNLSVAAGAPITAIFKASSVVIGVRGG